MLIYLRFWQRGKKDVDVDVDVKSMTGHPFGEEQSSITNKDKATTTSTQAFEILLIALQCLLYLSPAREKEFFKR